MLILLVGTGIFLTVRTRFLTWRNLGYALKSTLSKEARTKSREQGDVSPFSALMAIPNLICMLLLSGEIAKDVKEFQPEIKK